MKRFLLLFFLACMNLYSVDVKNDYTLSFGDDLLYLTVDKALAVENGFIVAGAYLRNGASRSKVFLMNINYKGETVWMDSIENQLAIPTVNKLFLNNSLIELVLRISKTSNSTESRCKYSYNLSGERLYEYCNDEDSLFFKYSRAIINNNGDIDAIGMKNRTIDDNICSLLYNIKYNESGIFQSFNYTDTIVNIFAGSKSFSSRELIKQHDGKYAFLLKIDSTSLPTSACVMYLDENIKFSDTFSIMTSNKNYDLYLNNMLFLDNQDVILYGYEKKIASTNRMGRILRTNSQGNIIWDLNSLNNITSIGDFVYLSNGDILFTGSKFDNDRLDFSVMTIDVNGNIKDNAAWAYNDNNNQSLTIAVNSEENNYYVFGYIGSNTLYMAELENVTKVDEFPIANNNKFSIIPIPNPVPNGTELKIKTNIEINHPINISITDLMGNTRFEKNINNQQSNIITVSEKLELPTGCYFIRLNSGEQVLTKKLIVTE